MFTWKISCIFHEFSARAKFDNSFNASLVALTPMKAGALDVKDFCSISLLGGVNNFFPKSSLIG
jgi:hypothetical protein